MAVWYSHIVILKIRGRLREKMSPVVERLRVGVSGSFKSFAAAPVSVDFATAISTAF